MRFQRRRTSKPEDEYFASSRPRPRRGAAAELVGAGATRNDRAALRSYGANLGLAFGCSTALDYGGSAGTRQNVGDDFREGR